MFALTVVVDVSVMAELALCCWAWGWQVFVIQPESEQLRADGRGGMCANVLIASAIEWPPWLGLEPATVWECLVAGSLILPLN